MGSTIQPNLPTLFEQLHLKFISENMNIKYSSIEEKLKEPEFNDYKQMIEESISKFIFAINKYEKSGDKHDIYSLTQNRAEKYINDYAEKISLEVRSEYVCQIIDTLRHAFSSYAYDGLHQLYTRQENEDWYPKIILKGILKPNDIHTLDDEIELYRGCDIDEYNNQSYGQAWTTSLEIAKMFAFKHYVGQPWFENSRSFSR